MEVVMDTNRFSRRPKSSLEEWLEEPMFLRELIGYVIYIAVCLTFWIKAEEAGWKPPAIMAAIVLTLVVLTFAALLFKHLWHRLEFPEYYRRDKVRMGGLHFNPRKNRLEIPRARRFSQHDLDNYQGPQLSDPDNSY